MAEIHALVVAEHDNASVRPATLNTYQAAADVAMRSAVGRGHNDFKIELAKRTLCRTLADAAQISIGRQS